VTKPKDLVTESITLDLEDRVNASLSIARDYIEVMENVKVSKKKSKSSENFELESMYSIAQSCWLAVSKKLGSF
jgi:hypothetical protein